MKRSILLLALAVLAIYSNAQITTPDKLWGQLFKDVQLKRVFADNKTFVDCTAKSDPAIILAKYAKHKNRPDLI